jgi:uncharacterized protein YdhG (YjbR/CyaY superfamily)
MSTSTKSGFTAAEREAMKARAEELRSSGRGGAKKADEAQALLDKIAEMSEPDRTKAERIHAIISATAPEQDHTPWYGTPAYAKDGKVLCFFKPAEKFGARYATLGFNDVAQLDDGDLWPTEYAVADMTPAVEKTIKALVEKAVG